MRTRSQAASPGGFVSLETDRAPRRRKTPTTDSSTGASKVQKPAAKQPAKKATKRTRKAAPKRKTTKKKQSTSPDGPPATDQVETQTESVTSVPADELEKENIESEHPAPFIPTPQHTQENPQLRALSATETPARGRVLSTPVRQPDTGPHSLSMPASASSVDTQVCGSALFAEALEAINAPSPFVSHEGSHDTHFTGLSPVVGQPTTDPSQLSQGFSFLSPCVSSADHGHFPAVQSLPQTLSAPVDVAQVTSASFHPQQTPDSAVQEPVNFWTPSTLSPIFEEPESSSTVRHSTQLPALSEAHRVPESSQSVPPTSVHSSASSGTTTPEFQRDSPGQRAIFSAFQQTGTIFRAAISARPSLANRRRAFNSIPVPIQDSRTPATVAEATSFSGSVQVLAHSPSFASSTEEHLPSRLSPRTPQGPSSTSTQTTPGLFLSRPPEHHLEERPRCIHCSAILQCPNGHPHGAYPGHVHSGHNNMLTKKVAPRKRAHTDVSDNESADIATPSKRRNIGPPGSTPYVRRSTPLSNRLLNRATPYSEQRRRRVIESQGRIEKTLFRLPQLVAQTEADRQEAAEPPLGPCKEPDWDKARESVGLTDGHGEKPAQEPSTQPLPVPETPQRGWNIRGLINSVPRSFSRILPVLGLSPEKSREPSSQPPASERIDRTLTTVAPSTIPPTEMDQERKEASPHDLTYSLFPAPIDKRRYLEAPTVKRIQTDSQAEKTSTMDDQARTPEKSVVPEGAKGTDKVSRKKKDGRKKRKRSPSPDVIPNPPGCSYGMDLRYFCYSSESEESEDELEEETRPSVPPEKASTATKPPVRSIRRPQRPPPKKVRFDASPEDTPSKLRLRATDAYTGRQFVGVRDPFAPRDESSAATMTPTPASTEQIRQRPPGFIPNPNGTFKLDYDAFSSDSDSNGEPSPDKKKPPSTPTPMSEVARGKQRAAEQAEAEAEAEYGPLPPFEDILEPEQPQPLQNSPQSRPNHTRLAFEPKEPSPEPPFIEDIYPRSDNKPVRTSADGIPSIGSSRSAQIAAERMAEKDKKPQPESQKDKTPERPPRQAPPPRPTPAHATLPPSTPAAGDNDALARARSLAEKYKPKTPSGLRTASRYSSPLTGSPEEGEHLRLIKVLGDDEFARDAQWLYANCPSGDLGQLAWPRGEGYVESLGVDPQAGRLLAQLWEEGEVEEGYGPFCRSLEEFGEALA